MGGVRLWLVAGGKPLCAGGGFYALAGFFRAEGVFHLGKPQLFWGFYRFFVLFNCRAIFGFPPKKMACAVEYEMEPFVAEVEGFAAGKTIGLFGSYGWGDGQWMRDWEDRMNGCGAGTKGDGMDEDKVKFYSDWDSEL